MTNPVSNLNFQYHDVYSYYKLAEENDGHYLFSQVTTKRTALKASLSDSFLMNYSSSDTAERNTIRYASAPDKNVQNMVYTDIINLQDGSECFLIVTSSITPLTNTVEIVRDQLAIVSVVFVLLAVIISLYASYRIAKPISKTNTAAKELAKKNYDVDFNARGYLEVEELNETLNYAKTELAATEKLQKELIANISHDLRTQQKILFHLGTQSFANTQFQEAIGYFNQSIALGQYNLQTKADAIYWRGESYYRLNRMQEAARNFNEYLNLTPDRNTETYALAYYNLAYIAFHEKDYTLAQNRFLKFTQLEKGENATALADAYNRIGDCHLHCSPF